MYIRKALIIADACLICLALWMVAGLFLNWRSQNHKPTISKEKLSAETPLAAPNHNQKKFLSHYAQIHRVDIFKTKKQMPQANEPVVQSRPLDIELIGTSVGDGTTSRAIVLDRRSGREEIVLLNGRIQEGQLVDIRHDRAVFLVNGRKETRLIASLEKGISKNERPERKSADTVPDKGTPPVVKRVVPRTGSPLQTRR
ncbi:MAG: hypothetical protein CVU57_05215 [Deltaproteobacteria bacterium HGW-Deltaproteobacteria-15]|jgi:hypothetical protein|nr:MAG: hypothetical protein CVU57_05215 [Deltaproteobacteria bacterium HGW-Deltaproteobacteria-15]